MILRSVLKDLFPDPNTPKTGPLLGQNTLVSISTSSTDDLLLDKAILIPQGAFPEQHILLFPQLLS